MAFLLYLHDPVLLTHLEDALSADGAVMSPVGLDEVALGAVPNLLWNINIINQDN